MEDLPAHPLSILLHRSQHSPRSRSGSLLTTAERRIQRRWSRSGAPEVDPACDVFSALGSVEKPRVSTRAHGRQKARVKRCRMHRTQSTAKGADGDCKRAASAFSEPSMPAPQDRLYRPREVAMAPWRVCEPSCSVAHARRRPTGAGQSQARRSRRHREQVQALPVAQTRRAVRDSQLTQLREKERETSAPRWPCACASSRVACPWQAACRASQPA